MGRRKRHSGGHVIQHAEELFRQSVKVRRLDEVGQPDYKYVALAIGADPHAPPAWAILECIELRRKEEQTAARGHAHIATVLDEIVRFFARKQQEYWLKWSADRTAPYKFRRPSLRSAITQVARQLQLALVQAGDADDAWTKPIREAWDYEQKHDLAPDMGGQLLEGFETTSRISRVIMQDIADERGDPADVTAWAWITKLMIERSN